MPDHIGKQFGNYRLVKLLGEGGFAEVYLGEHIYLGTYAAVKILTTKLTDDEITQFRNEARTIIGLEHPNIVHVLDFGMEGRIPFIVMGYAPHGSLRKIYPKGTRLPLSTLVTIVRQIASALQYIHDQKLIHRDIKLENMLVGRNNEILLSDFGIAAVAHNTRSLKTQEGSGTIYYMAPEQIQGKPRPASDQYSLGIVVYELLCGVRPFNGTYWEITTQHLSAPPPPFEKRLAIPSDIEQIVMTALAKDPKLRFANVQAFARALEQACKKQLQGTLLFTYRSHDPDFAEIIIWSPNSRYIASKSKGTIHIWDAVKSDSPLIISEKDIHLISNQSMVWSIDGKSVIFIKWSEIQELILTPSRNLVSKGRIYGGISISPNGKFVTADGNEGDICLWNIVNKEFLLSYKDHLYKAREYARSKHSFLSDPPNIISAVWSPDGKYIASLSSDTGGLMLVWEVASGKTLSTYLSGYYSTLAWSPNGKQIACCVDKEVQLLDVQTGTRTLVYEGHYSAVTALTWSPDGKYIASGDMDKTIQVWNASTGSHVFTYLGHTDRIAAVAWSPDGTRIASASRDKTVQVWQAMLYIETIVEWQILHE